MDVQKEGSLQMEIFMEKHRHDLSEVGDKGPVHRSSIITGFVPHPRERVRDEVDYRDIWGGGEGYVMRWTIGTSGGGGGGGGRVRDEVDYRDIWGGGEGYVMRWTIGTSGGGGGGGT